MSDTIALAWASVPEYTLNHLGRASRVNVQVGDASARTWALRGAAAGGAVTAAIWLLLAAPLFALIGVAIGSTVGAGLGVVVGSRSNARWAGDVGAAVVPAFAVAFLNGLVLLYLVTHAH